ncbi:hypothetical protein G6F31_021599 [Rhizopus arrhizus]|nr:hypothetical protein G6F31_021599 [Rhizopus arrhizus]
MRAHSFLQPSASHPLQPGQDRRRRLALQRARLVHLRHARRGVPGPEPGGRPRGDRSVRRGSGGARSLPRQAPAQGDLPRLHGRRL